MFQRGDFVEFDGLLAVVVGTFAEGDAPEDHICLWFGEPQGIRKSEGGSGGIPPEVWIVPEEYCKPILTPTLRH